MISSVESQSSGLTQMFFQNRFPEPKKQPLFSLKNVPKSDEDSSSSSTQEKSGLEQANFSQAMQNNMVQIDGVSKEESKDQKQNSDELTEEQESESSTNSYDLLKVKARYNTMFWS